MFRLNNRVKMIDNRVISCQNYSTPGVYKIFNVKINTEYRIILEGYVGLSNTKLWIADMYNNKIYFKNIDDKEIIYKNKQYQYLKIGILFSGNFKIGDYYIINDIKLIENTIKNGELNITDELKEYQELYYNIKSNIEKQCIIKETKLFNNVLVKDKLIIQLSTSDNIKYFDPFAKRKYKLIPYYDKTKPVIFYGCYDNSDLRKIKNHTGHKVLIWGGSDIMNKSVRSAALKIKNLKHVAQSSFIKNDLKRQKQSYIYLPFAPTVSYDLFSPIKKGEYVYIYTNACNQEFYGSKIYNRLIKHFAVQYPKLKFIVATNVSSYYQAINRGINCKNIQTFNPNDMYKVYSQCFIGLRLTKHDGISATVQELGMLGIKTVHNGETPNCINYKTYEDIVNIIQKEIETIGTVDTNIGNKTKEHLQLCDDLIPYLFKTITVNGEIYVMINYNKWQSYNSYIKRKNTYWIMYDNNGNKLKTNSNTLSNILPIDGWY
jgi:hypothetical protein